MNVLDDNRAIVLEAHKKEAARHGLTIMKTLYVDCHGIISQVSAGGRTLATDINYKTKRFVHEHGHEDV